MNFRDFKKNPRGFARKLAGFFAATVSSVLLWKFVDHWIVFAPGAEAVKNFARQAPLTALTLVICAMAIWHARANKIRSKPLALFILFAGGSALSFTCVYFYDALRSGGGAPALTERAAMENLPAVMRVPLSAASESVASAAAPRSEGAWANLSGWVKREPWVLIPLLIVTAAAGYAAWLAFTAAVEVMKSLFIGAFIALAMFLCYSTLVTRGYLPDTFGGVITQGHFS